MVYQKDFITTYYINGHHYTVKAPALFDSKTNELLSCKILDDQAAEIARQKYRDEMNLISPKEIKQYRAENGLTQLDLAKLTGLSKNTIALYEAGAFPTKVNNKVLKSVIERSV